MQEIVKIVFIGIAVAFISLILKSTKPEFVLPVVLIGSCVILGAVLSRVENTVSTLKDVIESAGIDNEFCEAIIKICGVCFMCDFASATCRDSGCAAVAESVETAGRICITAFILPFALSLLEMISDIIQSNVI